MISDLTSLIKEELNVKNLIFIDDLNEYMTFTVKPNFKEVGKVLGSKMKEFTNILNNLSNEEIGKLNNNESIIIKLDNKDFTVEPNMIDIRYNSKEGFNIASLNNNFVILDTELTSDLIKEGIAREMISKVQNIRKSSDFNIVDRIKLYYNGDDLVKETVNDFKELIENETLSTEIIYDENIIDNYDLNGHEVNIKVEKTM